MKRLTREHIRQKFDAASAAGANGSFAKAVTGLSSALNDLRLEGIDVELALTGCASEMGFMLNPGNNVSSWRQRSSGILRIGNSQHLVSFCTQVQLKSDGENAEWKDIMLMLVSKLDIRLQGMDKNIRTEVYNLREGDSGLAEFQEFVITKAGSDALIARADSHNSLSNVPQINMGLIADKTLRAPKLPLGKKPA